MAGASQDDVYSDVHQVFLERLDTLASALTTVVTAASGSPREPNAYPDGCGAPYADPLAGQA